MPDSVLVATMHVPSTPGPYQARPKPSDARPGPYQARPKPPGTPAGPGPYQAAAVPNVRYHWVAFYEYDALEGEVQGTIRATKVDVM